MSMKSAMGAVERERRKKAAARRMAIADIEKTMRVLHPDYSNGTIKIMVAFQLGGWDKVDSVLNDMLDAFHAAGMVAERQTG